MPAKRTTAKADTTTKPAGGKTTGRDRTADPERDEVAARTGPDAPADDRYHHTFTAAPSTGTGDDWPNDPATESMHNANRVGTHQYALHRGLHPTGEARFDGHSARDDGSVDLHYSVPVRPAHAVDQPSAETVAPAELVDRMGGTTTGDDG